jgi:hypothetical protein
MNQALNLSIPQRLFFIRITVTLALIISFLLSFNLWGASTFFPDSPLYKEFSLPPFLHGSISVISCLSLIGSLILRRTRTFIAISFVLNLALVLLDLNRLQAWFYIYNAILFVLLFYDGRVDVSSKYTATFILIQMIVASVYVYNGLKQLNPLFIQTDFHETISPLSSLLTERQFGFFLSAGKFVPWLIIFTGICLIVRPMRYLGIFMSWLFHILLLILLFPSEKNSNYALWFMNLVFAFLILFLYSGQTRQKHFSFLILLQKPLFYLVVFSFWLVPAFNYYNYWPKSPSVCFMYGKRNAILLSNDSFGKLPGYLRHFCDKKNDTYVLRTSEWCLHELRSELVSHASFNTILRDELIQITSSGVKETEDELSSL